jgi:hypothetical protein
MTAAMRFVRLALASASAAAFASALAGCPSRERTPCAPSEPARLEVRDGAGALELSVKESSTRGAPPVYDLCGPSHGRVGSLELGDDYAVVLDRAGQLLFRLKLSPDGDPVGWGPRGERLRVHHDAREWRVLKPDGVPFGAITGTDGGATVFDAASRPIAGVKPRGADQVLAAADGATTRYVVPAKAAAPAGVFALPGLAVEEQVALYFMFPR